tara:strand:+ start:7914 stop:9383 length:1470 start_codon:yes stop_codon:yes gene_type:complete
MDTGQSSQATPPPPTQTDEKPLEDPFSPPDFLRLQQIPVNYIQQVETDLLEPVVFNQGSSTQDGFARFTLQNKGFLHSHSKIFLAIEPTDASDQNDCYFAPHIGVAQLIKKAVLKIGNKTLNELDSWGGLHAVKSSLISNENNLERELYTTGRCMNYEWDYEDKHSKDADGIRLNVGVEEDFGHSPPNTFLPDWAISDGAKPNECPSFGIDLSDLFPFLKLHQLPLYMINEPINIELTFHPTTQFRTQIASTDAPDNPVNIVRDQLKFCADYIFYGATDEMERYANANKDLNFSFVDYRVVEHSLTKDKLASGIIQNLGMANRIVPRIVSVVAPDKDDNNEEGILGQYQAMAPGMNGSGNFDGVLKYNVRYNDRFEYTTDIDNSARLFSLLTDSEGLPMLNREMYSDQGVSGGISSHEFEGRVQKTELGGRFFYLGSRLTNGRVGQRGIELHLTMTGDTGSREPNLLRSYCEYVRVARLVDGMIEIYNA